MFKLTPSQIRELNEFNSDKRAAEETLKIALTFHTNVINSIGKEEKKWWERLSEIHGFDVREKGWMVGKLEGTAAIVRKEDEK